MNAFQYSELKPLQIILFVKSNDELCFLKIQTHFNLQRVLPMSKQKILHHVERSTLAPLCQFHTHEMSVLSQENYAW